MRSSRYRHERLASAESPGHSQPHLRREAFVSSLAQYGSLGGSGERAGGLEQALSHERTGSRRPLGNIAQILRYHTTLLVVVRGHTEPVVLINAVGKDLRVRKTPWLVEPGRTPSLLYACVSGKGGKNSGINSRLTRVGSTIFRFLKRGSSGNSGSSNWMRDRERESKQASKIERMIALG